MATTAPRFQYTQGTAAYRRYKWIWWAVFILFAALVAFAYNDTGGIELFGNGYNISLPRITKAIAFMVAILGLQLVAGFTGQLSLGQGFFFGGGAYLAAWLVADHNWAWFSTLIVVVPVCFLLGMAFGIPALRIKGLYLALVTLGLAAVFPAIVQLEALKEYTNGAGGKLVDSDLKAPDWMPFDGIANVLQAIPLIGDWFGDGDLSSREADRMWKFLLLALLAGLCFKMSSNLVNSRPGRAMRAIRDNETSSAVTGINLSLYKTLAFGVASALAGVGGMIYVAELGIASPGDFTQIISIYFIVGLVVGGVGTLQGAVIGGLAITFIPEWASATEELPVIPERWLQGPVGPLFMGALLIILTFVLPGGVVAGFRRIKARFIRVLPAAPVPLAAAVPAGAVTEEMTTAPRDDTPTATVLSDLDAVDTTVES